MQSTTCIVCDTPCIGEPNGIIGPSMNCPRCGRLWMENDTWRDLRHFYRRASREEIAKFKVLASHVIRRSQPLGENQSLQAITKSTIDEIHRRRLPTPDEQANFLLLWIGDNLPSPEAQRSETELSLSAHIGAGLDGGGLVFIVNELQLARNLITASTYKVEGKPVQFVFGLTFKGWSQYSKLKNEVHESRTAFMAMKFDYEPARIMYEDWFVPAAKAAGFVLRRVDTVARPGLIDVQMMVDIRAAAFVVADLTERSVGAYWEAGFATGLGKPVIHTCEEEAFNREGTHFDTNHHVTIKWSGVNPSRAASDLKAMIRNALPDLAKLSDD